MLEQLGHVAPLVLLQQHQHNLQEEESHGISSSRWTRGLKRSEMSLFFKVKHWVFFSNEDIK